jgi:hypothetical protein
MENVSLIETGALAAMILFVVQLITYFAPKVNKMHVTLGVSLVLSILSFVSIEAIGYLEAVLAVLGQVFVYDVATKTVK